MSEKGIIKYTSRDYESLMKDFWEVVPTMTELWRPEADSDPGVVLGKYLASAADMLGTNLDIVANEMFAPSVTQRKNAEKILALIGYDLGFFTAARTEVTFTNNSGQLLNLDFGFNGSNFCTLNAYTDITNQSRVITYNILPMTNKYGSSESRSIRQTITEYTDVFASTDSVALADGQSVTRVAIEGELRSYSVSVAQVKQNNYIITLPSQHVDTSAIWIKAKSSLSSESFLETQWIQCRNTAEFITPEPRFAVTYDSYSNAQITVSNYLNQLENYENNYLVIYWIDCSGVIGCVGEDVLSNLLFAKPQVVSLEDVTISNLSNTVEMPHTHTVTGKSPETAREAYLNSRNYINTWDSLITLPDYNRFLSREPGVDCGIVVDCQKILEYNLSVYNDENLTDAQKSKMYVSNYDFPAGDSVYNWKAVLDLGFDPSDPNKFVFATNFKRYTAMCFAIHNDFLNSSYGQGQISKAQINNTTNFVRYKPPVQFISQLIRDFTPLKSMAVDIDFGYARIFNFYIVGQIFTKSPVSRDVGNNILAKVKESLAMYFAPASRSFGQKPTVMEIVNVIQTCDDRIAYFDAGSMSSNIINWYNCDCEYFNLLSFARYVQPAEASTNLRIAPECLIK